VGKAISCVTYGTVNILGGNEEEYFAVYLCMTIAERSDMLLVSVIKQTRDTRRRDGEILAMYKRYDKFFTQKQDFY
jgi:hypothetical protein